METLQDSKTKYVQWAQDFLSLAKRNWDLETLLGKNSGMSKLVKFLEDPFTWAQIEHSPQTAYSIAHVSCCTKALLMITDVINTSGRFFVFYSSCNQLASYTDAFEPIMHCSPIERCRKMWVQAQRESLGACNQPPCCSKDKWHYPPYKLLSNW